MFLVFVSALKRTRLALRSFAFLCLPAFAAAAPAQLATAPHVLEPDVAASRLVDASGVLPADGDVELDGVVFRPLPPLHASPAIGDVPAWAAACSLDPGVVAMMEESGNVLDVELPLGPGASVVARLRRFDVVAPDATLVLEGAGGARTPLLVTVSTWTGHLLDDPDADVFVGLSPTQAQGWITTRGTTHIIATRPSPAGPLTLAYDLRNHDFPGAITPASCQGAIAPPGSVQPPPTGEVSYAPRNACRAFRVAVDTDNEFTAVAGGTQTATDYAVMLVAASNVVYTREAGMGFELGFLRLWNVADPWTAGNTSTQLDEFVSHWRSTMPGVVRSSAHLFSGRGLGGGIAYLSAACWTDWGFAVSANLSGSFPFPIRDNAGENWDLIVVAHEWGHQFGTHHTHNVCAYDPVIDACGRAANRDSCEVGTRDCSVAAAGDGTIMSYCHTCTGGTANIKVSFGPRVSARIAEFAASASCATTRLPPSLDAVVAAPASNVCPGTPVTLTAQASGDDLRFQWFRNGTRVRGAVQRTFLVQTPTNNERWDVMVYSPCGVITTQGSPLGVTLEINGPDITRHPESITACPSESVEVSVIATGASSYQWQVRDLSVPAGWKPLEDGPVIIADAIVANAAGAASPTLVLADLTPAWRASAALDARAVRCLVSGSCAGSASVLSTAALVSRCITDVNCDGGIDGADLVAFFSLWENGAPLADVNDDGGIDGADVGEFFRRWELGAC
jgi:hypothetical protein